MVFRFLRTHISARRNFRKKRVAPFDSSHRDESNGIIMRIRPFGLAHLQSAGWGVLGIEWGRRRGLIYNLTRF
uniref:Candidate secreted effector n=1 Tax=Meloidogyne incognita TaxID=6306 RepID=A0A914MZ44_MELIC